MIDRTAGLTHHGEFRLGISRQETASYLSLPSSQQPDWGDPWLVDKVRGDLTVLPGLVEWDEVRQLRRLLAEVAAGRIQVIQAGDCAEVSLHGNTVQAPGHRKTRLLSTVLREVAEFQTAVASEGGTAGGLHLEATADDVAECAADESALAGVSRDAAYTTLCDPRLNPRQALTVASAWHS